MSALVFFVEKVCFVGPKGGVIVAPKNTWFESSSGEEAKDTLKVV
jgi:hypothetical protein